MSLLAKAAVRPGIVSLLVWFTHQSLHEALLQYQQRLVQQPAQSSHACVAPTRLAFLHQLHRKGSGNTANERLACSLPIWASGLALNGSTQRLHLNRWCSPALCRQSRARSQHRWAQPFCRWQPCRTVWPLRVHALLTQLRWEVSRRD